jgi:hypothetical protein
MTITLGLKGLLKNEIAIGVVGNHDILVTGSGSNWEAACVVGVEPAEGHNGYNDKVRWDNGLWRGDRWEQWYRCERLGLGGADVLPLLGQMTHDGLVCIGTIPRGIGICETVEGVTIPCPDGIEPRLFDGEAKTCMIETDEGSNAGQVKAAGIEGDPGGSGS